MADSTDENVYALKPDTPVPPTEVSWQAVPASVSGVGLTDAKAKAAAKSKNSRWILIGCNALVFVSSVCVMVLELTASRLIAKHVGSSLYTWTSVIGVVLAGITVGNFLGGWLADRTSPGKLLNWLFLIASILCLSVLWLDGVASDQERPASMSWPVWVVCVVSMVFFLPSLSLGTISPVVASLALSHSKKFGVTVGNVYAWGALGSIVGTFLTGFVLIDMLGTRAIVALTAGTLASMGFLVAGSQWAFRAAVLFGWLQFIAGIGLTAAATDSGVRDFAAGFAKATTIFNSELERVAAIQRWSLFGERFGQQLHEMGLTLGLRDDALHEYHDESNYSYINVKETTENGERVAVLKLDKLIHSYFLPDNPTTLNYDYERVYAAVTEEAVSTWDRKTVVSLDALKAEILKSRTENAAVTKSYDDSNTVTPPKDAAAAFNEAVQNQFAATDDNAQSDPAEKLPPLVELCQQLPSWLTFEADTKELVLRGGMTPDQKTELLRRHPYASYWTAVDRLEEMTHRRDWGDFGSVPLVRLPASVVIPEDLRQKVLYDRHLQHLNVYRPLTAEDVQALRQLGDVEAVTFREAVERLYGQSRRISTLFLGGGGFVFPRWIDTLFPFDPLIHVAELDPGVKAAVQARMGLPPDEDSRVKTTLGDARNFVDDRVRANADAKERGQSPVLYDFVYGDAFNDFSVPWHLTTLEFSRKIAELLHPKEGIYQVNLIDIYPRTEFPFDRKRPDGSDCMVDGDVPDILTSTVSEPGEWTSCPVPFEGLEVEQSDNLAGYRLAVRGVMSKTLRERLLKLADGKPGFAEAVKRLSIDSQKQTTGRFLGSYVATISRVFPHVYLFSSEPDLPNSRRDTFVIVASQRKLDLTDLRRASHHWTGTPFASLETNGAGKRIAGGQMEQVIANSHDIVLTDNYAPVDNLLSGVFDAH